MNRKSEGIPKPLWQAAKALYKEQVKRVQEQGIATQTKKFKDLPDWSQHIYLKDARAAVKAYREAQQKAFAKMRES